jgi:hypothetical protein
MFGAGVLNYRSHAGILHSVVPNQIRKIIAQQTTTPAHGVSGCFCRATVEQTTSNNKNKTKKHTHTIRTTTAHALHHTVDASSTPSPAPMNSSTLTLAEFLAQESLPFPASLHSSKPQQQQQKQWAQQQQARPATKPKKRALPQSSDTASRDGLNAAVRARAAEVAHAELANQPGWRAAVDAIDSLTKSDVFELRALASPPTAVQVVVEALMILLVGKIVTFADAKRFLANYDR